MKFLLFNFCIIVTVLPILTLGHQTVIKNIDHLKEIKLDIAPRSIDFFHLKSQSNNPNLQPSKIELNDQIRISFKSFDQSFHLHLKPNPNLFHPTLISNDHLVYKGHVFSEANTSISIWSKDHFGLLTDQHHHSPGWARISIYNPKKNQLSFEGAFKLRNDIYHIKLKENYDQLKSNEDAEPFMNSMVIYRDSDSIVKRDESTQCGFDHLSHGQLFKREPSVSNQGCPTTKKILYMGAAADCTYIKYYKTIENAKRQIIQNFNMASALFEDTFNVSLGLIELKMMDSVCTNEGWDRPCIANYSLSDRLSDFSLWRAQKGKDGAGLWHLMTNCPTGVEVGLAWLKQMCNSNSTTQTTHGKVQYVSGAGVSAITRDEWKVVAHEIGHGFGAIHDCSGSDCPCSGGQCNNCCELNNGQCGSEGYLMSAITNSSAEAFSPCSINTICKTLPTIGQCLLEDPEHHLVENVYQINQCGNGVKEEGEECDTGGQDTPCCDSKTCKFKANAVCEDKNDGCCHDCQIRSKGYVCRSATSVCDIPEICTGESATCPEDTFLQNGLPCGQDGFTCASGVCTSRDAQCYHRGYVMNITQSCQSNNEECKLLCNSPTSKRCLIFSGHYLDGTPCGSSGGTCLAGICSHSKSAENWFQSHIWLGSLILTISLLVAFVLCGVLFWYFKKPKQPTLPTHQELIHMSPVDSLALEKVDSNSSEANLLSSSSTMTSVSVDQKP